MLLDEVRTRICRLKQHPHRRRLRQLGTVICLFHVQRHPRDMSTTEIKVFLSHLAIAGKVLASIRKPAKSASRFLYRQVLNINKL